MVIFHNYVNVYQRVNHHNLDWWFPSPGISSNMLLGDISHHIPISENITMETETVGFSHGIFQSIFRPWHCHGPNSNGARDVHDPGLLHRRPWWSRPEILLSSEWTMVNGWLPNLFIYIYMYMYVYVYIYVCIYMYMICICIYIYEWPCYMAHGCIYGWMVNHLREPASMSVWNKIRSCDSILKKPACSQSIWDTYLQNAMEINWGQPSGQTHAFLCNLERLIAGPALALWNHLGSTLWFCQNSYWKWPIYSELFH
jgi:hypothetical protein